jgi:hypothetical protein
VVLASALGLVVSAVAPSAVAKPRPPTPPSASPLPPPPDDATVDPPAVTSPPPRPLAIGAPAAPLDAEADDGEVVAKTAFLHERLAAGESSAKTWSWAWVGIYTALTAGNFTIAGLSDSRDNRVDFIARGSLSAIGLITSVALWPAAATSTEAPRVLPSDTPEQRAEKLRAYERSLAKVVKGDSFGTSWKAHAIGFGVNGIAGALVAFGDGRPKQGALIFLGGFAVAEVRILTRPTTSLRTREAYEKRSATATGPVTLSLVPTLGGVQFLGTF